MMCLGNKFYKQINSFLDVVIFEVDLIHLLVDKNCYFKHYICFGNKYYKQINSFLDVVVLSSFEVHSIHFLVELKCYFKQHILKGNKSIREPVKKKKCGKFHIGSDPPSPMTENVENFQKKK